jgi:hypothetical protein
MYAQIGYSAFRYLYFVYIFSMCDVKRQLWFDNKTTGAVIAFSSLNMAPGVTHIKNQRTVTLRVLFFNKNKCYSRLRTKLQPCLKNKNTIIFEMYDFYTLTDCYKIKTVLFRLSKVKQKDNNSKTQDFF